VGVEYYLEFLPPSGGVTWVLGLCKCSHIRVDADVEWGWDWMIVRLDNDRVARVDADMGTKVHIDMDMAPAKTFTRLTVGVEDPAYAGLKNIKVWYTCEEPGPLNYLEFLPPSGGIAWSIAPCNCTWIRAEAVVDWGLGRFRMWLDGEQVINEDAVDEHFVVGEASLDPPSPVTQIVVGVNDPSSVGLREIRVWYVCEAMPDAFQLVMVVRDQRIVEPGGRAEARVRWGNLSPYPFWTNLRMGLRPHDAIGIWTYGDWVYAEAPPSSDVTTDVSAPVPADWWHDMTIDARIEEMRQGVVSEVEEAYSTPLTESDYHDFRVTRYW